MKINNLLAQLLKIYFLIFCLKGNNGQGKSEIKM